jgi:hypothetical protein
LRSNFRFEVNSKEVIVNSLKNDDDDKERKREREREREREI